VAECRQFTEKPIFAFANFLLQYDGVFGVDTKKEIKKCDPNGLRKFAYIFISTQ
jgi:hypothetical protein